MKPGKEPHAAYEPRVGQASSITTLQNFLQLFVSIPEHWLTLVLSLSYSCFL